MNDFPTGRKPWKSEAIRQILQQYFPEIIGHHRDANKEAATTSTWLVTLTTGFLAFLLARPGLIVDPDPTPRHLILILAVASVGAGVYLRVVIGLLDRKMGEQAKDVWFRMAAGGKAVLDPSEPEILADVDDLASAYQELVARPLPPSIRRLPFAEARHQYSTLYELCIAGEKKSMAEIDSLLGAVSGQSAEEAGGLLTPAENEDRHGNLRTLSREINRMVGDAGKLFAFQLVLFFLMMAAIGWTLW